MSTSSFTLSTSHFPEADAPCLCGRTQQQGKKVLPLLWRQCCGLLLQAGGAAANAEQLMRSRYCAYVLGDAAYLLKTWHASTRPATMEPDTNLRWLGLDVRRSEQADETHAMVEFVARYREQGKAVRMHERSQFVRENDYWLYVDGQFQ